MNKPLRSALVALGLMAASASGFAAPIFEDNFNSYALGLNTTNFSGNWTVSNGTVDTIGTGFFDFYPGNGHYIDLDGSTSHAGTFSSKTLNLNAGTYTLQFSLGGSTRGDTNTVDVNFGAFNESFTLASNAPLAAITRTVTLNSDSALNLSFHNHGGDNLGLILDNVSVSAAPEPETYALMLAGLGMVGQMVRRKKNAA